MQPQHRVNLLDTDFKYLKIKSNLKKARFSHGQWRVALVCGLFLISVVTFSMAHLLQRQPVQTRVKIPLPLLSSSPAPKLEPVDAWRTVGIKSGDNLAKLLSPFGIDARQIHQIMSLGKPVRALRDLQAGAHLRVRLDEQGVLQALAYDLSEQQNLQLERTEDGFKAYTRAKNYQTRLAFAQAQIHNSLFAAGRQAGLNDTMIMQLASIFAWDIDFALDIREGDGFSVLYKAIYHEGEKVRSGEIVAAEFVNRGKTYRALRFTDDRDRSRYYTPQGRSVRKAFLRSPVRFTRISSRFSSGRYHPVLHRFRAHKGVDYAARRGTPVRAAGDGRITYRARKGGYGNTVIIQHGHRYTTLYAHLSRFNRKARHGQRIKQGQIIGYVGSSGLATGPHLHYEFRVNGRHHDPLRVKLPKVAPLARRFKKTFDTQSNHLLARLDFFKRNTVALADLYSPSGN